MGNLFSTLTLDHGAVLKNRIVMSPMTIQSAFYDGRVTNEMIEYYALRSGDAAAIIVESAFVENHGRGFHGALGIDTDAKIEGLSKLSSAIQEKGSKAILQIYHAGRMASPELNGGAQPISASSVAALRDGAVTPLEMSAEDVEEMIYHFGAATKRAILAGFDGVEIHGANTYLIQQFFSPHSNRRQDQWGGSREKRMAFPIAVLEEVKKVVKEMRADNFIIGYRFSPEEIEEPGIRFEDTMHLLNTLAAYTPDYFHFSMNTWQRTSIVDTEDKELLIHKYRKQQAADLAKIPIIGVGSIRQKADAERALEDGYDIVSVGKAYLVEPAWATKVKNNEECKVLADTGERDKLKIPAPLWDIMDSLIIDRQEEERKLARMKELQNVKVSFVPGTYSVSARGHNGSLPMEVAFSEDKIMSIVIDDRQESEGIANPAFERLPQLIIDGQTLNVDVISGATVTSQGVIDGVAEAVNKAGGNSEVLRYRPKPAVERSVEVIEETADIVIVGGGGAGLSAAVAALDKGKSVVLLEKFPAIGGNTVRTGGWVNAAQPEWQRAFPSLDGEKETLVALANTPYSEFNGRYLDDFKVLQQQIASYLAEAEQGHNYLFDSVELHRIQTYLGGKRTDLKGNTIYGQYDLVENLTNHAMETVNWLSDKGVDFNTSVVDIPVGALWRRSHKPKRPKGAEFIEVLQRNVVKKNGRIMTDTKAEHLIVEDGKVVGVEASKPNGTKVILHVNNAVILTSGGFGANTKMLQQYNTYWEDIPAEIKTTNSPAITGDGIRMGEEAGADLVGMGFTQLMPVSDPKSGALLTGLIVPPANFVFVNQEGKRFVDECESRDVLSKAFIDHGGLVYMIADEGIRKTAANTSDEKIEREIQEGVIYQADTLEELAVQIGVPGEALIETIKKYNQYVDRGHDPEFHKSAFDLKVKEAPFYATPRKPAVHHTMGGLKIDTEAHVINKDGDLIPGLYGAGEVAGGIHAGNRLGGNALIDIFTYGRIAGENAAALK